MEKCVKCGATLEAEAAFCTNCGAKVVREKTANNDILHDISAIWPEWRLKKRIGKGSYGVVYEAVRNDNGIESNAAIKIISIPADSSEVETLRADGLDMNGTKTFFKNIVDDFVSEIQLMESFKGIQNIVSVEDYKVVEKSDSVGYDIYIRMELLTPFNAYLVGKTMTEGEAIKLGVDICTALEICSQRNIIHRDIKPENIFVNNFGYFKLGDFGIARKLENVTGGLSQKGTPNYMAPEVINTGKYDERVDIYSLGVVLYRLLNDNRLPFLNDEKQLLSPLERKAALERRIGGEALPAPCNASPAMANLVLRACAFNPCDRFSNATEMKRALTEVANGTYSIVNFEVDKTTSIGVLQKQHDANQENGGAVVANGGDGEKKRVEPVVNSFDGKPKKKKKKGKIIAIAILVLVLAAAITLTVKFFTSPAYEVYSNIDEGKFETAVEKYYSDVEDSFIQKKLLGLLIGDRAADVGERYESGKTNFDSAIDELNALAALNADGTESVIDTVMQSYADTVVARYENGEIDYDDAMSELQKLKDNGYSDGEALIKDTKTKIDTFDTLEQAQKHYENGDYEQAISAYSKISENNESYKIAQEMLGKVYSDYVASTAASAEKYYDSGDYKQAIRKVDSVCDALPSEVDKTALVTIKEKSFAAYKSAVADEVNDCIDDSRWSEAFTIINQAVDFDDNDFFRQLKTALESEYVGFAIDKAELYVSVADYPSAITTIDNALAFVKNNDKLTVKRTVYIDAYVAESISKAEEQYVEYDSECVEKSIQIIKSALKIVPGNTRLTSALNFYSENSPIGILSLSSVSNSFTHIGNAVNNKGTQYDNVVTLSYRVQIDIDYQYSRLTGIYFQNQKYKNSPVEHKLQIYGAQSSDWRYSEDLLWSGTVNGSSDPIKIDVDISNYKYLRFYMSPSDDDEHTSISDLQVWK